MNAAEPLRRANGSAPVDSNRRLPGQKASFIPNCTCLPGFEDVTNPKFGPWELLGAPKIGVLVRLMNCVMNWKFVLSEMENVFTMLMSDVASPGPRKAPA